MTEQSFACRADGDDLLLLPLDPPILLAREQRSELKIWIGSERQPVHLSAHRETDLAPLQHLLASKLH